ncbi:hypothetical protein [Chryseobacterium balustinum]|nr:hypothetical protein [Chryseobacterium balustinum]
MKYIVYILIILFNVSCLNSKNTVSINCNVEDLLYINYESSTQFNDIEKISNLKNIDDNSFRFYLKEGVDSNEIKKENSITISKKYFFKDPNLQGDILIYIMGFNQNNNIKHYLAVRPTNNGKSSIYILNQVNGKVNSMFLAYSDYNNNYESEHIVTEKKSTNVFKLERFSTSDTRDHDGKYSRKCIFQLELNDEGHLKTSK